MKAFDLLRKSGSLATGIVVLTCGGAIGAIVQAGDCDLVGLRRTEVSGESSGEERTVLVELCNGHSEDLTVWSCVPVGGGLSALPHRIPFTVPAGRCVPLFAVRGQRQAPTAGEPVAVVGTSLGSGGSSRSRVLLWPR